MCGSTDWGMVRLGGQRSENDDEEMMRSFPGFCSVMSPNISQRSHLNEYTNIK